MGFGNIQNPIAKISAAVVFVGVGIAAVLGQIPPESETIGTTLIAASAGFLFATNVVGTKPTGEQ